MSGKYALIIGNTEYIDPGLAQLTAPGKDAEDFARVLEDQEIGAFDNVKILLNQLSSTVSESIDEFFDQKKPDDLLVLYFSGHGVRDELGSLYLAVRNTIRSRLRSTAIKSDYIREAMDQSRSKRQVLILDCCNSGAFSQGTKAATGGSIGTASAFEAGYGRIILTASDSTQFAWEGDQVIGETDNSLFTHYLVEGLKGDADNDGDGRITVDELYDYAYEKVRLATPKQTPSKFSSKQQGEITLRQSTRIEDIKPLSLSAELMDEIEDTRPYVREAAVQKLEKIIKGRNIGLARSAKEALEKIIADENTTRRVAQAATQVLQSIQQSEQLTIQKETGEQKLSEEEEVKRIVLQKAEVQRIVNERNAEAEQQEKEKAERYAAQKDEEERVTKAQAEANRKAKEETERVAAQKAEEERIAKAQAEVQRKAKEIATPVAALPIEAKVQAISATPQKKPMFSGRVIGFAAVAVVVVLGIAGLGINALLNNKGTPTATQTDFALTTENTLRPVVDSATPQISSTATNTLVISTATSAELNLINPTVSVPLKAGDQRPNSKDGATLIYIPPGEFTMGLTDPKKNVLCPAQNCDQIYQASQPAHRVTITRGYWIYRTEVSNAQYAKCVASRNCESPRSGKSGNQESYYGNHAFDNYPVVWVDWDRANKYCLWSGGRLPTSAEWEYAARKNDERLFPWGDDFPKDASQANVNGFFGNTKPVDELVNYASPFGLLNMTGNVWEWVSDWYSLSYYTDNNNWIDPKGPPSGDNKVGRGGSWAHPSAVSSVAIQDWEVPNSSDINYNYDGVGFRCVIDQP